jgi:hypothetical protein
MGEDLGSGSEPGRPNLEFERLNGGLDAALMFAAAAENEYQNGKPQHAAACLSDAMDIFEKLIAALPKTDLTGAQTHDLKAKLIRLQHLLDGLRKPGRHEAA